MIDLLLSIALSIRLFRDRGRWLMSLVYMVLEAFFYICFGSGSGVNYGVGDFIVFDYLLRGFSLWFVFLSRCYYNLFI